MPSPVSPGAARGFLVPIGGAEKKEADRVVLDRFARLAGGADARLVVLPTASELPDTGDRYRRLFEEMGAGAVEVLPIQERPEAMDDGAVRVFEGATGVFLTGGNQLRLSTILGGTPVAQALRRLNAEGVHVGGTSAGAAIMPEHMIAGGKSGPTPRADAVILAPGLGLTNRVIVDQHFRQRGRLGRLLTAVSFNPFVVGLGVDEDTAAFIGPDDTFEVVGSGGVTVVDPAGLEHSSMDSARPGAPVSLVGITLHVLAHGARYDLEAREATVPEREEA